MGARVIAGLLMTKIGDGVGCGYNARTVAFEFPRVPAAMKVIGGRRGGPLIFPFLKALPFVTTYGQRRRSVALRAAVSTNPTIAITSTAPRGSAGDGDRG